jgi:hypothetical protein
VTAVCALWAGAQPEGSNHPAAALLLYTAAPHYDPLAWLRGAERFPGGAKLFVFDRKASRLLVPNFFASADAAVSFDGMRILFAGKQHPTDVWQVWEIALSGGPPAQLTSCSDDCVFPLYLPEDRAVYAHKVGGNFQLETTPLKGGVPLPLTHLPGSALPSDVLRDGRILFQAAYPLGGNSVAELYTVYSDGSGVESYRCDHGSSRHSGRQLTSGDVVFAVDYKLARFTSSLAHQVDLPTPTGDFAGDPVETPEGEWILAWRPDSKARYAVSQWNPGSKLVSALVAESDLDVVQPRLLTPRPIPNRHPSGLHDWAGANVLCLNAHTSKFKFADDGIATVRLYGMTPRGQRKLLGGATVENDGSFFLHVPSDQPLQFELVDRSGTSLQREHGWFWLRRGEQRVCVGCHAGPERAPENAMPAVLVKSTEPVDLTLSQASQRKGGH